MIGATWEAEEEQRSYYQRGLPYAYYGTTGLNTGICLLSLRRMRQFDFEKHIGEIYARHKHLSLKYGDQCLVNIFLAEFPSKSLF